MIKGREKDVIYSGLVHGTSAQTIDELNDSIEIGEEVRDFLTPKEGSEQLAYDNASDSNFLDAQSNHSQSGKLDQELGANISIPIVSTTILLWGLFLQILDLHRTMLLVR